MAIKCALKCGLDIKYEIFEFHLNSCEKKPLLNKSKLCQTKIITKIFDDNSEIKKHNKECSQIPYICGFCKKEIKIRFLFTSYFMS